MSRSNCRVYESCFWLFFQNAHLFYDFERYERNYASLCLLPCALLEHINAPFHVMDKFDEFLDPVIRGADF